MKSLRDYSLNISEEEYHAYPAWSYSLIARYAKEGFSSIATIHDPIAATSSMEFGSLFDCIITDGENLDNRYVVSDTTPPPAEKLVYDNLLKKTNEPFAEIPQEMLITAIEDTGYSSKYKKLDTQLSHLNEFSEYYDVRRTGRKAVSREDMEDALQMASNFKSNPFIKKLFGDPYNTEYIFQLQLVANMNVKGKKAKVKCMLDAVMVNHEDKTIQPIDIKTSTMPAYDWPENFIKFRYDIQASLYTSVLRTVINAHDEYKDYTILPFVFCDISRTDKQPVSYVYDPCSEDQADGLSFKEYRYKNWRELLAEIIDYEESDATVPSGIVLDDANDLVAILNSR